MHVALASAMAQMAETVGIRTIEVLFGVGVVGSALVLILSTIEDVRELFEKDEN